jgi:hypothetical protein
MGKAEQGTKKNAKLGVVNERVVGDCVENPIDMQATVKWLSCNGNARKRG